ncbi:unnamed protein product [Didymodactylos carnosus]|uniref:G-protein coupled receptors family 1 profile domain-containing protein n=1 Tax=Didymodactylos carnosus TaxID=1234261 RepID=A0A813PWQ2_9BILA|nr:unnamed protein product [Didymodactylos carnosus]CAF0759022.1 unnamed protein product [Didymodactylos carnosus]CAF3513735.1 unnamed protein product [Didymodactylos carnosus]CAF3539653.1 unnamed protein product [Didymodactylos carnosus]
MIADCQKLADSVNKHISPAWIFIGTISNILSIAVLLRRRMRIHSTFCYLAALSFADLIVLYTGMLRDFLFHRYNLTISTKILCKLHVFAFYYSLHLSSWLLVAVNIDRYIAVTFLNFSRTWCTSKNALFISCNLALILCLVDGHLLLFVDSFFIQNGVPVNEFVYKKCFATNGTYEYFFNIIFPWFDISLQVLLPFLIMLFCNITIVRRVLLTKRRTNHQTITSKLRSMCIMIISVSFIFFVLELPVGIFIIFYQSKTGNSDSDTASLLNLFNIGDLYQNATFQTTVVESSSCVAATWAILNIMMYTNHVINFISYCMTGSRFRSELYALISCRTGYIIRLKSSRNQKANYDGLKTEYLKSDGITHERRRSTRTIVAFMLNGAHKSRSSTIRLNKPVLEIRERQL